MSAADVSHPGPLAATALFVPGVLYGAAVRLRNRAYDLGLLKARRLPCPVIAFGNLTAGGTGKTPLTSFAAATLRDAGYRVGILSRGYRREGRAPLLVSDGRSLLTDAAHAGDEPYLLARDNPAVAVAVGADRLAAAGLLLAAAPCEVVLLDDAYQHRALSRDVNVLLVDGREPFGNGRILPFGPLREPVDGVRRADAVVVTRGGGAAPPQLLMTLERHHPNVPVFHAALAPRGFVGPAGESAGDRALSGFAAFAFSGIARPDRFEDDLRSLGVRLAGTRRFADHHPYNPRDLEEIAAAARAAGAEVLVTTEKDLVRLPAPPPASPSLFALAIAVTFPDDAFTGFLLDRLGGPAPTAPVGAGGRR
jgi:tetraacyldisaccharide 4'-kinase